MREFQVLTNSYSAEFGKASGGVVNIVTKSGTNQLSGNAFVFLPRRGAERARGTSSSSTRSACPIDRDKAPFSQEQFGGTARRADPAGPDVLLPVVRAPGHRRQQLRHDRRQDGDRAPVRRHAARHGRRILRAAGFPVETGNVPYDVQDDAVPGQGRSPAARRATISSCASTTRRHAQREHRAVRRHHARRAAARRSTRATTSRPGSYTSVFGSRWVNELRFQYRVSRSGRAIARSAAAAGRASRPTRAARRSRSPAWPASAGSASRRSRGPMRCQVLDTVSLSHGSAPVQGRRRLQLSIDHTDGPALPLHFGGRYIFQPLPAIPGVLPAPCRAIQAVALGLARRLRPGLRHDADTLQRTRSLAVRAGRLARDVAADAQVRRALPDAVLADLTYAAPGTRARIGSRATATTSRRASPRRGIPRGDRPTALHGAYGLFFDNHITGLQRHHQPARRVGTTCARWCARSRRRCRAWNAPGPTTPRDRGGRLPDAEVPDRPRPRDALRAPYVRRPRPRAR